MISAPIAVYGLAALLLLFTGVCLTLRDLWRACQGFVAFALLMSLAWLLLGAPWLALAEALLGALLTGGALLWTLRGRGALPRLPRVDETSHRALVTAPVRWLLILSWLGLTGTGLILLLGTQTLTPPISASSLLSVTGLLIAGLGLWAFASQHHLLRRLLGFNLLGSGVFLLLAELAGPVAEVRGLIMVGLVVALLGSVLGARLLLRLHALAGQVTLKDIVSADPGAGPDACFSPSPSLNRSSSPRSDRTGSGR